MDHTTMSRLRSKGLLSHSKLRRRPLSSHHKDCETASTSPAASPPSSLSHLSTTTSSATVSTRSSIITDDATLAAVSATAFALCAPPVAAPIIASHAPLARASAALAEASGLSLHGRAARARAAAAAAGGGRRSPGASIHKSRDAALRRVILALRSRTAGPDAAAMAALKSTPKPCHGPLAAAAALGALDTVLSNLCTPTSAIRALPGRRSARNAAASAVACMPRDARELRAWARVHTGAVPSYLQIGPTRARRALAAALRELVIVDWSGVSPRIKWLALFAVARAEGNAALCAHAAFSARRAGASPFQLLLASDRSAVRATSDHHSVATLPLLGQGMPYYAEPSATTAPLPPTPPAPVDSKKDKKCIVAAPAHASPIFDLHALAREACAAVAVQSDSESEANESESDSESEGPSTTYATVPGWDSDDEEDDAASSTCNSESDLEADTAVDDVPVVDGIEIVDTVDDASLFVLHQDQYGRDYARVLSAAFNAAETAVLLLAHASHSGEGLSAADTSFVRHALSDVARIEASGAIALAHALHMWTGVMGAAAKASRKILDSMDAPVRRFAQSKLGAQLRLSAVGQRVLRHAAAASCGARRMRPQRLATANASFEPATEFQLYRTALLEHVLRPAVDDPD